MDCKISIIVPIYNVEQYLDKCIESLINQTYTNLEIILVDDGSPDNCSIICDEYAKKDNRIKVIHKKNGGLSDARNTGLDISTGEYIAFIDSDDWIELNMLESMLNNMIQYEVDIVVCNIKYVYDDKIVIKYKEKDRIFNKYEAMQEYIKDGIIQAVAWNKLYKKSLIDNIRFKVNKTNEDEFFTYRIIDRAEKIYYNSKPFYNYLQRNSSIMGKYSIKRIDGVEACYERLNFIKEQYPMLYIDEKKNFYNFCVYNYKMILDNPDIDIDMQGRIILKNYLKKIKFNRKELKKYSFKDKIKIFISKISLNYYCRILNIFNK